MLFIPINIIHNRNYILATLFVLCILSKRDPWLILFLSKTIRKKKWKKPKKKYCKTKYRVFDDSSTNFQEQLMVISVLQTKNRLHAIKLAVIRYPERKCVLCCYSFSSFCSFFFRYSFSEQFFFLENSFHYSAPLFCTNQKRIRCIRRI